MTKDDKEGLLEDAVCKMHERWNKNASVRGKEVEKHTLGSGNIMTPSLDMDHIEKRRFEQEG